MARTPLPFRVIPCAEWGASDPSGAIARAGKPERSIFHHTAGHVPNSAAGETYLEGVAYARSIQRYHKSQGWVDSGHNFLVTRGGYIFEGRHGSLASIRVGRMVVSAHCPGQNDQPGVEHEHQGSEAMTPIQREASVWLHAWIAESCGITPPNLMLPHRRYFSTSCPGSIDKEIPALRARVIDELHPPDDVEAWYAKYGPKRKPPWFFPLLREAQKRYGAK